MSDDLKTELIFDFEDFSQIEHTSINDLDFEDDGLDVVYASTVRTIDV